MEILTTESLKNSQEYKEWILGRVALIHNVYHNSKDQVYPAFIVVSDEEEYKHKDIKWQMVSRGEFQEMQQKINGNWTITRFFTIGCSIQVSVDYQDISTEDVFELLLNRYSRGLA